MRIIGVCSILMFQVLSGLSQESSLQREQGAFVFSFRTEKERSYKIFSSSDLSSWNHLVSVRGDGLFNWTIPAAQLMGKSNFFRAEKVVATGTEDLIQWSAFREAGSGRFVVGLIGDSYTHARERYSKRLKEKLGSQFGNIGAGYCSFSFNPYAGKNGSIDDSQLDFSLNFSQWTRQYVNGYGPDAGHIVSAADGAVVNVEVKKSLDSLRVMYVNKPGTGGFRYRIAGGTWSIVTSDAPLANGEEEISLTGHVAPYSIEIETPSSGTILLGCEGFIAGDGVVCHKLGASGARAEHFVDNNLARDALESLNLDMAVVMFGTNEHLGNRTLESYRLGLQNIANTVRGHNASTDLVFILPCYTKYENEISPPRRYNLQQYGQVMREVAQEYNAAFIDLTEVFGPATELQNLIDAGLMSSDRVHPTTGVGSGGYLIADTIYREILGL